MPPKKRSNKIGDPENVEAAGKNGAGDAIQTGQIPGYLRLVYREMRRNRAVETLFDKDLVAVIYFELLRCCISVRTMSIPGTLDTA